MDKNNIYENIAKLLKERDRPVTWLEKEAGLGNGVVASWKQSFPRVNNLQKVANVLGVELEDLIA